MRTGYEYRGTCHCGAVEVVLRLSKPAAEQRLRACQCGFCRPRGVRTVSDAAGHATVRSTASGGLKAYRFALKTADYLLCAACGTYIGAVQVDDDMARAVINVGGLDMREFADLEAEPVVYQGETVEARKARRRSYWMPATIEQANAPLALNG